MGGAKKAKSKGKVPSNLKGSGGRAAKTGSSQPEAGSVADARARMARIQPFWKTLSAQSRIDLLSIPVAAAKQRVAELAAKRQAAQLTPVQHAAKQADVMKQGEATINSRQPLSVRHHVTMVLPKLDIHATMTLQRRYRTWKIWTWSSPAKEFYSAQAFGVGPIQVVVRAFVSETLAGNKPAPITKGDPSHEDLMKLPPPFINVLAMWLMEKDKLDAKAADFALAKAQRAQEELLMEEELAERRRHESKQRQRLINKSQGKEQGALPSTLDAGKQPFGEERNVSSTLNLLNLGGRPHQHLLALPQSPSPELLHADGAKLQIRADIFSSRDLGASIPGSLNDHRVGSEAVVLATAPAEEQYGVDGCLAMDRNLHCPLCRRLIRATVKAIYS
eukprot:jgi/Astpho2/9241/fgenesh1_pg.00138_%23_18_t